MKRALFAVPVLLALTSGLWLLRGAYSYYYTETYPASGSSWTTTTDGILIHNSAPWGGREAKMTLEGTNSADLYMGADTFVDNGVVVADNVCFVRVIPTSNFISLNCVGQLAASYRSIPSGSTIRAIMKNGTIIVYLNNQLLWVVYGGIGSSPGVTPGVAEVSFGYLDTTAPTAISSGSITKTAYSGHVDLQWPAADDGSTGSGIFRYELYRDSSLLTTTSGLSFSDTTVVPNHTYSYSLKAVDYHLNEASTTFSVTTPQIQTSAPFPSATPEGRRVGVRPTGAYWGAGTENIDVMSGNLNFSLPLLAPQARGGWGASVALSYNSQNFRWDGGSGTNWHYGKDVGYGYGWRLMIGSITPVYSDPYTVSYYLFTDSSGAE